MRSTEAIFAAARRVGHLTREEQTELGRQARAGDRAARERLIVANTPFAFKRARRWCGTRLALDDLYQEAMIGLMHAVDKFDPDRGVLLTTYAAWWIDALIRTALRSSSVVRYAGSNGGKVSYSRFMLEVSRSDDGSRTPPEVLAYVAERLGLETDHAAAIHRAICQAPYLADDAEGHAVEVEPEQETALARAEVLEELAAEVVGGGYDARARDIIGHRLLGETMTLAEIAERHGVTRERVRQIEVQTKARLRERLEHMRGAA